MRCGAVRCGAVRCGAVRCGAVRCGAVRCGAVRCGAVRCGAVRCGAVRYDSTKNVCLQMSSTFPLHLRPLDRLSLFAPRDTFAHLQATYPASLASCWTPTYLHKTETEVTSVCNFRCRLLRNIIPFVYRTKASSGSGILETLVMADRVIHARAVDEPSYVITDPYTLRLIDTSAS